LREPPENRSGCWMRFSLKACETLVALANGKHYDSWPGRCRRREAARARGASWPLGGRGSAGDPGDRGGVKRATGESGGFNPGSFRTVRRLRTSGIPWTQSSSPGTALFRVTIVIDTNVLSELMKPLPSARVVRWMNERPVSRLFTTTITMPEVLYGVEILPVGKRRIALHHAVETMFGNRFAGRILSFDVDAAHAYAEISAKRRKLGRRIGEMDAQIAAIARSHGAAIATRDIDDFQDCGVQLIDPWA
jgi:toxin FitB